MTVPSDRVKDTAELFYLKNQRKVRVETTTGC
eukprot:COSAG05_NODE_509_length_9130_cov_3.978740_7_plen_32_part_00